MTRIKKDSGVITEAQERIPETAIKDFSSDASIEFTNSLRVFSKSLYDVSIDTANKYTSALVSPTDVEHARRYLYRIPKKQTKWDIFLNEVPIPLGFALISIALSLTAELYLTIITLPNLGYIWVPIGFFGAGCIFFVGGMFFKFESD